MTSILISRFLLDLRRLNDADERNATSVFLNTSIFSARQFHSEVIGNLGEELDWATSVGSTAAHSDVDDKPATTTSQDLSMDTLSVSPSGLEYELSHIHES